MLDLKSVFACTGSSWTHPSIALALLGALQVGCGSGSSGLTGSDTTPVPTAELESAPALGIAVEPDTTFEPAAANPDIISESAVAESEPAVDSIASTLLPLIGADLKVFPGAEGFGTDTQGGRGGRICTVSNLNGDGNGSLRSCLESSGPRIVIFTTGGTIEVDETINVRDPYVSVYGQTAPGDGIMVRASLDTTITPIRVATHDVLIQHMRFRAGSSRGVTCCRDAASIGHRDPGEVYNVVIDHVSFSWGVDEIVDVWYDAHDITISRSIFSEGLRDNGSNDEGPAGRGLIIGSDGAHSITLHHNFFAHSFQRNPFVKISGIADIVNTLVYHWVSWGSAVTSDFGVTKVNFVKNKYIPLTNQEDDEQNSSLGWGDFIISKQGYDMEIYFEGNIGHNRPTDDLPEWQIANTFYQTPYNPNSGHHTDQRHPAPKITETPVENLEAELPRNVGANIPRQDSVDLRLFEELKTRTGVMPNCVSQDDRPNDSRCDVNVGGWPFYDTGSARIDSDSDGIPDLAEQALGFDENRDDSREDKNGDGYLNIEDWVHSIQRQN